MSVSTKVPVFAERLARMQQGASAAMVDYTPGGAKVPDNVYTAREECTLKESSSGKLMVSRTFSITDGEFAKLKIWDNLMLEKSVEGSSEFVVSDIGVQQVRRWIESHGIEYPENDFQQLENIIMSINEIAPMVKIRQKTTARNDNEYVNVTVLEVYDTVTVADLSAAEIATKAASNTKSATRSTTKPTPAPAPEPEPVQDDNDDDDGIDSMTIEDLKSWIEENGLQDEIKVAGVSVIKLRKAVREYLATHAEDTTAEETVEEQPAEDLSSLLAFCAAQGIDEVSDTSTKEEIADVMRTYKYIREEITDEEFDMLCDLGLGDNIEAKPRPKAPVKAPVRPPVKAPAKAPAKVPLRPGMKR